GISQAMTEAEPNAIKRLFEQLVHEVRVTGRRNIKPYFRIPTNGTTPDQGSGVRALSGSVPPAGFEPAPPPPEGGALSPELRGLVTCLVSCSRTRTRPGRGPEKNVPVQPAPPRSTTIGGPPGRRPTTREDAAPHDPHPRRRLDPR